MSKVIHNTQHNLSKYLISLLHRGQKSKDPYNKQTYFNPARLLLKTLGTSGIKSRCSSTFSGYINNSKNLRIAGFSSAFILLVLSALSVYPIVRNLNLAEAVSPTDSTTTLNITTTNSANVQLLVKDSSGTFASSSSSESLSFNVTTNNYTGYKLTLLGKDSTYDTLYYKSGNETIGTLTSINENKTSSGFSSGYFGYTLDGTNFKPAPNNETGDTIDDTNVANNTANTYTLGLGVKANYSTPTGTYTNTYVLTAVGNPTPYTLNFNRSTTDSVENMPSATSDSIKDTKVALPTNVPTRTGYTFAGWCDTEPTANSNGSNTCPGTTYQPSTESTTTYYDFINRTAETNIANLYAVWNINQYTCTKQYRLQSASGGWGSYVSDGSEQLDYNSTCTYTKSVTDYTGISGTNSQAGTKTATMTEDKTLSIDMYRNTYVLTINKDSYISSVTGAGTYRWGQSISISATASSGNEFVNWTQPSGTAGSFGSTTSASTTFTMGKGAATIQANGKKSCQTTVSGSMQDFNPCDDITETSGSLTDSRDAKEYTVAKIKGSWWMTKNLAIGCDGSSVSSKSLTPSTSNIASSWSTPTDLLSGASSSTQTADYSSPRMQCNASYGAWYNYAAASAGTITGSSNGAIASYDVCPAGWRLPSYDDFHAIANYNSIDDTSSFSPVTGGYYSNGSRIDTQYGRWWSSVQVNTDMASRIVAFYYSGSSLLANGATSYRYQGTYIRCIKKTTLEKQATTLQALGNFNDASKTAIISSLPVGSTYTLSDSRDSQVYRIAKLADGNVWMIDNLNLGAVALTTDLTSSNTNVNTSITASTFNGWGKTYGTNDYTVGRYVPSSTASAMYGYGTLYNYYAASAGTIAGSSNSSNAQYDICPYGWRLPTGGTYGDFGTLYRNYSSSRFNITNAVSNGGAGFSYAGYFTTGSPTDQGEDGQYWSSTYASSTGMYAMSIYYTSTTINLSSNYDRYIGNSIRCVLK